MRAPIVFRGLLFSLAVFQLLILVLALPQPGALNSHVPRYFVVGMVIAVWALFLVPLIGLWKPLYVVVEESCASAAYYIAVSADRIFVDKASIVGSIGVLMEGFGFVGLMDKLGVERRLLTAGANKGFFGAINI